MRTRSDQYNFVLSQFIDQQPVRLDMAFSRALVLTNQDVITMYRCQSVSPYPPRE